MKIQCTNVIEQNGEIMIEILSADAPEQEAAKNWIHLYLSMADAPADVSLKDLRAEALRRAQKELTPGYQEN